MSVGEEMELLVFFFVFYVFPVIFTQNIHVYVCKMYFIV